MKKYIVVYEDYDTPPFVFDEEDLDTVLHDGSVDVGDIVYEVAKKFEVTKKEAQLTEVEITPEEKI